MRYNIDDYIIKKDSMDVDTIISLLHKTYWAYERPSEVIIQSLKNSLCFGVFLNDKQVGFARVVTDYATVYWLCDVIIDENHRSRGLGKKLVDAIVNDASLKDLSGILATKDAHTLYELYGFVRSGDRFMRK